MKKAGLRILSGCMAMLFAVAVLSAMAAPARALDMQEKWVYYSTNLIFKENVEKLLTVMRDAQAAGATHIQINDYQFGYMDDLPPVYFENIKIVREEAKKLGLKMVPGIMGIGSSGRYLYNDPNLADGIPVKNARFIVRDGKALPDPASAPVILNKGFDEGEGDAIAGWTSEWTGQPQTIFRDTNVKHGGKASFKMTNLDNAAMPKNPADRRAPRPRFGITQTVKVKPFQLYRLSIWMKTDGTRENPDRHPVQVLGVGDQRMLCFSYFPFQPTQDWTEHRVTFNTLTYDEIELHVALGRGNGGSVWFDDLTLEPAGLQNVLRRDLVPVVVTSENGKTTYQECVDYKYIQDPMLGQGESRGDFQIVSRGVYDFRHDGPALELTPKSRIKNGKTILISYYTPASIYIKRQVTLPLSEPRILDIFDMEMKYVSEAWQTDSYMMNIDEVRSGGWEPQPGGTNYTPGQLLGNFTEKGIAIIRKYRPDAKIYVWSDDFDPFHNAPKEGYQYLVNGSWYGSWEKLPKEVVIVNWSGKRESLKFFADRGHKQIVAGYYDATKVEDIKAGIDAWFTKANGIPGIIGYEYTAWLGNFSFFKEFFGYIEEWQPETHLKKEDAHIDAPVI